LALGINRVIQYASIGNMKHIAIVDDEATLRDNLSYALNKENYIVSTYSNGQDAWKAHQGAPPQLYLLDILMPRMDGFEFCRLLRQTDKKTPIIFLSSRDQELDKILGLEIGGDDYIGKPFSVRELLARIKAVLRRADGVDQKESPIHVGPFTLMPASYRVCWNGQELILTISEFRIFSELIRSSGNVCSRAALFSCVFPDDEFINERAVDSHIKRIRKKLESIGAPKNTIKTMYGTGYRFGIKA